MKGLGFVIRQFHSFCMLVLNLSRLGVLATCKLKKNIIVKMQTGWPKSRTKRTYHKSSRPLLQNVPQLHVTKADKLAFILTHSLYIFKHSVTEDTSTEGLARYFVNFNQCIITYSGRFFLSL